MQFGKSADYLFGIARAIDHRPVEADRIRKSVDAENMFEQEVLQRHEAQAALAPILTKVWVVCERGGHSGRTVTVKVKYSDFRQVTRSSTYPSQSIAGRLCSAPASTCSACCSRFPEACAWSGSPSRPWRAKLPRARLNYR